MTDVEHAPVEQVQVRRGVYHDSVSLLRVSQAAADVPGISAAQVAMATALNLDRAQALGFEIPEDLTANDLVITLRATDAAALAAGSAAVEQALAVRAPIATAGGEAPARTVRAAARANPDAGVVLLSVPGPAVLGEALDAIEAGRHVMIFSDNVPVADEIAIKTAARAAAVLAMGPDCGTTLLGGIGLGFANVLRAHPGPRVGIVAASGTGAQHLIALLDDAEVAVSHVLGVGGRDLSADVGGLSTGAALAVLDADPGTDHIVLISKPADRTVAARIRAVAARLTTPVSLLVIGPGQDDLTAGAERVISALGARPPVWPRWGSTAPAGRRGALRGLYSGGTLADEAMLVLADLIGDVRSNIPLRPELALAPAGPGRARLAGSGHAVVDLGDDEFTVGRPHPMIDPTLRLALLAEQAADPDVAVVLLDVVLGHAADADPAAGLAPAIRHARAAADEQGRALAVVIALCGTAADPQDRERQARALAGAGAAVFASNAAAARAAAAFARPGDRSGIPAGAVPATDAPTDADPGEPAAAPPVRSDLLTAPAGVICAGVDLLADALRAQAVPVVPVQYRPAAVADESALHAVLADPRRAAANAHATRRMLDVRAELVAVRPAREALGLRPGEFAHAGPPITFDRASGPLRGALIGAMLFEGLAADADDAQARLAAGDGISLTPCHDRHAVGPMAGVISPSMWLFELADRATGARAFCSLNEGLGKVLRYGAYGPEVIDRLRWMTGVLGPALAASVRATGPVDITAIIGQMIQMGDEGHNRNRAGTLMLLRELMPALITSGLPANDVAQVARFVSTNDHFFLNLVMPTGKLMGDAAAGVPGSSIVTAMCRNGTDFGIRVSGTGDEWFTGPALYPEGLFLPGFGPDDANPDIGDSAITETMGIGGMAMATAPAIVRFVGGTVPDALAVSRRMYEITEAENPAFAIPILEFRGAPTGIDVTRVLRTGILPQINTGMAGREAGTGQVGAGLVTPPMDCFTAAVHGLAARVPAG
ncbi:MAG TPA: DUF1116 domain-containing protein [Nakamurella multipartita]|nr:DUF1116 domain-containing protein [Nakamurella multipartita]